MGCFVVAFRQGPHGLWPRSLSLNRLFLPSIVPPLPGLLTSRVDSPIQPHGQAMFAAMRNPHDEVHPLPVVMTKGEDAFIQLYSDHSMP